MFGLFNKLNKIILTILNKIPFRNICNIANNLLPLYQQYQPRFPLEQRTRAGFRFL